MALTLHQARLLTPTGVSNAASIVVSDEGHVALAGAGPRASTVDGPCIDLDGRLVAPGFVDLHVHGGFGIQFGRLGSIAEDLRTYSQQVVTKGVTGFLCTVAAPDAPTLARVVQEYADVLDGDLPGAEALGLHLEGPFLNPAKRGAFDGAWIRKPDIQEVETLLAAGRGWIRVVTIAPELPGARELAARLRRAGVVVALGHSDADYAMASAALSGDWTHVSHAFNAQRGFHHREPGALGAVLTSQRVTAEVIADGVHVHPAAIRVLLRCLGSDRVVLTTDAMAGAGLSDGQYELLGRTVTVRNGQARLPDGTLAGSTVTLNQCVRNLVDQIGVPLHQAVTMASRNPARVLGLNRLGGIGVGHEASLTVIDDNAQVYMTCVRGRIVHRASPGAG
jgi:N-acetylglucosamine-6-phosphate deacetylase